MCTKYILLLDHALYNVCKSLECLSCFINLFDILPKSCPGKYPSVCPVSGPYRIRYPAFGLAGYPAKTVSGCIPTLYLFSESRTQRAASFLREPVR
jgi:hypothetical protein